MAIALFVFSAAAVATAHASQDTSSLRLDYSVTPAAGDVIEQNGLRLSYTLAEPVAGTTSEGGTRLDAGFQALFREPRPPAIFGDGFEASSP